MKKTANQLGQVWEVSSWYATCDECGWASEQSTHRRYAEIELEEHGHIMHGEKND